MADDPVRQSPPRRRADDVDPGRAWARLRAGVGRQPGGFQVLAAALLFLLGFAVVTQARQTSETSLSSLRQSDLVRLLDDVSDLRTRQEEEQAELRERRSALLTSSDAAAEARRAAEERLLTYSILAGTAPAVGPGITVVVRDVGSAVTSADLLDAVQELRDAGAEAIQIGDVRITAGSALLDVNEGIQIDGEVLRPPYTVRAIGDPQLMETAMRIPGGIVQRMEGREASVTVTQLQEVTVDALRVVSEPQYARPALPDE